MLVSDRLLRYDVSARLQEDTAMRIRTPADLGALIRTTRQKLRLDQLTLAKKIGVSRLWLVEIEKGKPRAEIGLVLRALDALHIRLNATTGPHTPKRAETTVDIDRIIATAREPRK
jgi:HTH-type transcriptional regulator / antitoxin HipB